jgi:hypothetical protein
VAHVVFIHGLDNKPDADFLHKYWVRKLAHENGVDLDACAAVSAMSYWADVLYPSPDANLAAYESAIEPLEMLGGFDAAPLSLAALPPEDAARMRRLAARFDVDPENPIEPSIPPEELVAVRQERIPVPAWLQKRIMARFVKDVHHYFFNHEFSPRQNASFRVRDELRRRFVEKLTAAAKEPPVVVVSHSMGTIIAYDCLMHEPDCPPIDGFMTIGSPLGLDEVQDFFPNWTRDDGFPTAKLRGSWVNVYDPLDVVAGFDPCLANDFRRGGKPVIEDIREDNWGNWRHSIGKYLQGKLLRASLAKMLGVTWP